MIQANELRIGNWIKRERWYKEAIEYYQIKPSHFANNKIILFQPIPITEEWLLKFGFEYFEENNSYQLFTEFGFSIWGRINDGFNIYVNSDEVGENIKYIHTLQNVYFALTNKELEYVGAN